MKPRTAFVTVSMPSPLRAQLTKKIQRLGIYGSTSDYVRDLIRRDLSRDVVDQVDQLLIDGVNSGPAEPMDAAWRRARRTALAKHVRPRRRKSARS
jgi:antitoxin ParD1/3/4